MTPKQAAEFLAAHDRYLILTHMRPDGDTIGCAAALCLALRQLGKEAHVLYNKQTTALFAPYVEGLIAPEGYEPHTVVSVDIAAVGLFPQNARVYLDRVDLAVDHHPSQEFFAKETCLEADRAACGEIIYQIISLLGPVTREMATALYVALSTDCGCFVYGNTTAHTHRIAAQLFDCGIDAAALNKRHFRTKSAKRMKLESMLIGGMELHDEGTIAIGAVTIAMMESIQATEEDAEDIAALMGQLEGVKTAVTLRELSPTQCKISMRTDPADLNASKVCALMGGGGHAAASGATVNATVDETRKLVMECIRKIQQGGED